jgi:two-component system, OmpR family, sensor kinase
VHFGRGRGGGGWHDWEGPARDWHTQHHRGSFLRRRIFWAMATAVLLTALTVSIAMAVLSGLSPSGWTRQMEQGRDGLSRHLARLWDDPPARDAFVRGAAADFKVDVALRDAAGSTLLTVGPPCERRVYRVDVVRDGTRLGEALICMPHMGFAPERGLAALLLVVAVFWAVSGRTARRIARPLDELAQVARKLGQGDLKARAGQSCNVPGEIGEVAAAVNEMATRIQKQLDDQKELLAAVSHELRTPLARIRLVAELARDGGASQKTFDDLDREVEEMDALVGQLLASSRLDFGTLSVKAVPAADQGLRALERGGLTPDKLAVENVGEVKADPTLLARALGNLLDNAKRHGGGLEQLLIRSEPGKVVFEAHDKGPGFQDGGAQAFEAFRPENGSGRSDGLGMGLGLVRRIARAHGGDAAVKNREGGGAVVSFWLPA